MNLAVAVHPEIPCCVLVVSRSTATKEDSKLNHPDGLRAASPGFNYTYCGPRSFGGSVGYSQLQLGQ